jgi:hypothetical protein
MGRRLLLLSMAVAGLAGCCSTERVVSYYYPPGPVQHVEVLNLRDVRRPYIIVGRLNVCTYDLADERNQAAEMGGDAIVYNGRDEEQTQYLVLRYADRHADRTRVIVPPPAPPPQSN